MGRSKQQVLALAELRILNEYNDRLWEMEIDGPVFRFQGREYPINTVSAEVILGAQTSTSRSTVTRIIGGGMVAGVGGMLLGGAIKKSADTSKVHITLRLPDGSVHTISKPTSEEGHLRSFTDRLESAVNREWPIETPYGTSLELDPRAKPIVEEEAHRPFVAGLLMLLIGAATFLIGWLVFGNATAVWVGLALSVLAIGLMFAYLIKDGTEYEADLDKYFPDNQRDEAARAEARQEEMWDSARKKARGEG